MSPTPSDARCARCGLPESDSVHSPYYGAVMRAGETVGTHAFVAPTRVDEAAPEPMTLGHVDHGRTTLTAAITAIQAAKHIAQPAPFPGVTITPLDPATPAVRLSPEDAAKIATPEQPAVTGEPEPLEPDFPPGEGFSNAQAAALGYALAGRKPEHIGIPQTPSGPSRPAVESEGSAPGQASQEEKAIALLATFTEDDEHILDVATKSATSAGAVYEALALASLHARVRMIRLAVQT